MATQQFDMNYIYSTLAKLDFNSCVKYIRGYRDPNPVRQRALYNAASIYERQGQDLNRILATTDDPTEKEKISFYFQRRMNLWGNNPADRSSFANSYLTAIENIGSDGDRKAKTLDISFDNESSYKSFVSLYSSGKSTTNNGKYIVTVNIEDLKKSEEYDKFNSAIKSMPKIIDNYSLINGVSPSTPWMAITGQNNYVAGVPYKITSKDENGEAIVKDFTNPLMDTNRIVEDAENFVKGKEEAGFSKTAASEVMSKPYMCQAQYQIATAMMNGQIDDAHAERLLKHINEYYTNLLYATSLANYEVFATEPNGDTMNFMAMTDSKEKTAATLKMQAALKEGRVSFRAASSGGRTGTLITIDAKLDKEGNLMENAASAQSFFVPDLFVEDTAKVMDEDVDARVLNYKAQHMAFNHAYDLVNGNYISDFDSEGGAIMNEVVGDKVIQRPLTNEEVNQEMLKNELAISAVDKIQNEDLTKYADRVKDYTEDQLNNLEAKDTYGYNDTEIQTVAQQYAQQIILYINNLTSIDEAPTEEEKNRINFETDLLKKNIISRVR